MMLFSVISKRTEADQTRGRAEEVVAWASNPRFSQILLRQTACFYKCHGTYMHMKYTNGTAYIWKLHGHPVSYLCPVSNTRKLRGIK